MRKVTYPREAKRYQSFIAGIGRDAAVIAGSEDAEALAAHLAANAVSGHGTVGAHDHLTAAAGGDLVQYLPVDGSREMGGNIIPALADTYDLGDETRMWRKIWASELDTVIFAENTMTLLGSLFRVGKGVGTFPADVAAADTQIDFGQAMTAGWFVELRMALKVEYLQVGALVSGTTYAVTRNLDGTGANDWAAGTPYSILGGNGDARIDISAVTTPKIRIVRQGASYNAQTVDVAIGDLNGTFGVSAALNGLGVGDYTAGNYLRYDPTNNFLLSAGGGALQIDNTGIQFDDHDQTESRIRWTDGATVKNYLVSQPQSGFSQLNITSVGAASPGAIVMRATSSNEVNNTQLVLSNAGLRLTSFGSGFLPNLNIGGNIFCEGDLKVYRGAEIHTGHIFVPFTTPLTSTSWDGDARSTTARTVIDLSAVFGVPAGVKAVLCRLTIRDSGSAANDCYLLLAPGSGSSAAAYTLRCSGLANDAYASGQGIVPCDASGNIYYQVAASGSGTLDATLEIWGYWI